MKQLLLLSALVVLIIAGGCKKKEDEPPSPASSTTNSSGCADLNKLIDKKWYCKWPSDQSVTFYTNYFENTGVLKHENPGGSNFRVVGTWSLDCSIIHVWDTTSLIPEYDLEIVLLDDSLLTIDNPVFGNIPYKDTPL